MRFVAEQAYSPYHLKAELVFRPTFQYFKTFYIFNSVIEIMNIYRNDELAGSKAIYLNSSEKKKRQFIGVFSIFF